jgi:2-keto-4-pentenoate hydratase
MTDSIDRSLQEGLRAQEAASRDLLAGGAGRLGWKAGFGTAAAIENLGTSGPLAGFLTDSTLEPSGASFAVGDWGKPVLEPEVAVRLAADVKAGDTAEEIEAAVGEVGAAIELVDLGEAGSDPGAILAANIFHRAVLLGDLSPLDPGTKLADVRIDVIAAGEDHATGADPAGALGDLLDVLAAMADLLADSEDGMRAGDVIITGAAIPPFVLTGGEEIEVRVGASTVAASID